MKSQDLLVLLKLASLHKREDSIISMAEPKAWPPDWEDWEDYQNIDTELNAEKPIGSQRNRQDYIAGLYTVRALANSIGLSKSVLNLSLNHCLDIGLAIRERESGIPRANTMALYKLIEGGAKYYWPTKLGQITRGISTAYAAPVLSDKLSGTGDLVPVWPHPTGKTKGQAVAPLHPCVTKAVQNDPQLYAYLALIDAIRVGSTREANIAKQLLSEQLVGEAL